MEATSTSTLLCAHYESLTGAPPRDELVATARKLDIFDRDGWPMSQATINRVSTGGNTAIIAHEVLVAAAKAYQAAHKFFRDTIAPAQEVLDRAPPTLGGITRTLVDGIPRVEIPKEVATLFLPLLQEHPEWFSITVESSTTFGWHIKKGHVVDVFSQVTDWDPDDFDGEMKTNLIAIQWLHDWQIQADRINSTYTDWLMYALQPLSLYAFDEERFSTRPEYRNLLELVAPHLLDHVQSTLRPLDATGGIFKPFYAPSNTFLPTAYSTLPTLLATRAVWITSAPDLFARFQRAVLRAKSFWGRFNWQRVPADSREATRERVLDKLSFYEKPPFEAKRLPGPEFAYPPTPADFAAMLRNLKKPQRRGRRHAAPPAPTARTPTPPASGAAAGFGAPPPLARVASDLEEPEGDGSPLPLSPMVKAPNLRERLGEMRDGRARPFTHVATRVTEWTETLPKDASDRTSENKRIPLLLAEFAGTPYVIHMETVGTTTTQYLLVSTRGRLKFVEIAYDTETGTLYHFCAKDTTHSEFTEVLAGRFPLSAVSPTPAEAREAATITTSLSTGSDVSELHAVDASFDAFGTAHISWGSARYRVFKPLFGPYSGSGHK